MEVVVPTVLSRGAQSLRESPMTTQCLNHLIKTGFHVRLFTFFRLDMLLVTTLTNGLK